MWKGNRGLIAVKYLITSLFVFIFKTKAAMLGIHMWDNKNNKV